LYEIVTACVRTAREIDDKSPTKVCKAYDQDTGEVFAGDTLIKKEIWSKSMALTNHDWNASLRSLYSNSCEGIINKVLDTNSQLILLMVKILKLLSRIDCTASEEIITTKDIRLVLPESKEDILRDVYTNVRRILLDHTATSDRVRSR